MVDDSHLDRNYFIDEHVYNCPFCKRRHVQYYIVDEGKFDWTEEKLCYFYIVECQSCKNQSMHLSYLDLAVRQIRSGFNPSRFHPDEELGLSVNNLDDYMFYSVPSSFFVLDKRIDRILRNLFTEAEGSLKSNFLTGASACARKIVYELAKKEGAEGKDYESKLKSLKEKNPKVDPSYFDTLVTIQQVTSDKVHEEAYDNWEPKHLRLILATIAEILNEIYVEPKIRQERRESILNLKENILGEKKKKTTE